jgi:hypothetical protein
MIAYRHSPPHDELRDGPATELARQSNIDRARVPGIPEHPARVAISWLIEEFP